MRNDLPRKAYEDPMHPPSIPTEVWCCHCGESYDSYLIEWREHTRADGSTGGRWVCPMPGCDGAGFGIDIWPTDPDYIDPDGREMGWDYDDEDDEFDDELMCDDNDDCEDDEKLAELLGDHPELADQPPPTPLQYGRLKEYFDSLEDDIPYQRSNFPADDLM